MKRIGKQKWGKVKFKNLAGWQVGGLQGWGGFWVIFGYLTVLLLSRLEI